MSLSVNDKAARCRHAFAPLPDLGLKKRVTRRRSHPYLLGYRQGYADAYAKAYRTALSRRSRVPARWSFNLNLR